MVTGGVGWEWIFKKKSKFFITSYTLCPRAVLIILF